MFLRYVQILQLSHLAANEFSIKPLPLPPLPPLPLSPLPLQPLPLPFPV